MNQTIAAALQTWVPIRLFETQGDLHCKWWYLGYEQIAAPFFEDTISICGKHPQNSNPYKVQTSIACINEWAADIDSIAPSAFIFHISRCGSTLVSQLLGLQEEHIVLSEVPFFDELLRLGFKQKKLSEFLPTLKSSIQFYGSKRNPKAKHLFIKCDSWHVHFYKEIRQLYPEVPIILLYRKPYEVMQSQQKNRGMQAIPGLIDPEIFGFDATQIPRLDFDLYMANVLETYFSAFIQIMQQDKIVLAVNYNDGIHTVMNQICNFLELSITDDWKSEIEQRTMYHAKYPDRKFEEQMDNSSMPAYLNQCNSLYQKMEALRLKQ